MCSKSDQAKQTNVYDSFYDDHSDRKSLEDLVEKLTAASQKNSALVPNSSPSTSKYKQLPISSYCSGPTQRPNSGSSKNGTSAKQQTGTVKRSKVEKVSLKKVSSGRMNKNPKTNSSNTKLPKLDGWLSKNKNVSKENNSITANLKDNFKNEKEGLVASANSKKSPSKESRKLKRQSSGSFAKYGILLPSFADILAYQKEVQKEKELMDNLHLSSDLEESLNLSFDEPEEPKVILDCKHLLNKELEAAYKQNSQYVYEIFHGIRYCERHERFMEQNNHEDRSTTRDLKYSPSMLSFTSEQKQQLLRQLHKEFDDEEGLPAHNQYFFKVLLPELCLKIFMDIYSMSRDEAMTYAENIPAVC